MSFSSLFALKKVDNLDLLKALGILLVLVNHSSWHNLQGGVNILILISGLNFARFSFKKDNKEMVADILRLLKKLLVPSVLLIIFYSMIYTKFDWKELFLISNFYYPQKISTFPVWYVQAITQLFLIIIPLAFLFNFSRWTKTHPIKFNLCMLALAMAMPLAIDLFIDSASLYWKLPHYIAWNFILGWVIWAMLYDSPRTVRNQLLCWVIVVTSTFIVLQVYQPIPINRFIIFSILVTLLILFRTVKIPNFSYRPVIILASAVFYIFLLHGGVMKWFVDHFGSHLSYAMTSILKFIVALLICCVSYIIISAFTKAWVVVKNKRKAMNS
ncbi:MAG: acyltransferase family protein [Paraglaciecola sp.]|uniref:acyltransferase family protein n=1 Tax=Paraglaciecola sp. TaxID=1920173 RepID=UPI0032983842